jgi:hypothetical protein
MSSGRTSLTRYESSMPQVVGSLAHLKVPSTEVQVDLCWRRDYTGALLLALDSGRSIGSWRLVI